MTGRQRRRRWLLMVGATLGLALVATGYYLKVNYDVMGIVEYRASDWMYRYTRWFVASSEEVEEQIRASEAAGPHPQSPRPARGPLTVMAENPRYFTDGTGRAVLLAGSHTWTNLQDAGRSDPPPPFNYEQYLDFLEAHGHNFFRLWTWECSRWSVQTYEDDYWFNPAPPFLRTGPGDALDGKPRWDLTQFDERYFERLRRRVEAAGERGMYVAVMLFNGWSVARVKGNRAAGNPWNGHPFNAANNINGVDGDLNDDQSGRETHELADTTVLRIQRAYVQKVVDTLNDLDNVLYEISNESHLEATEWQYYMIDLIKEYEATKPKQHPVGMTVEFPAGDNEELFQSNADWISPNRYANPPVATGQKVIITDTDHIWGIGGSRQWVWKSFTRGLNPIFMDGYDGSGYAFGGGGFELDDPRWVSLRRNLGYVRYYAQRLALARTEPVPALCSTGYCLAVGASELSAILVYSPDGGPFDVDLSQTEADFAIEWFDPADGSVIEGAVVPGGKRNTMTPPFKGDAVLLLTATD